MRRVRCLVLAVLLAAVATACSSTPDQPAAADPQPAPPAPSPEPEPEDETPQPVAGVATVRIMPVSNGPVVFTPGDAGHAVPEDDVGAMRAFVDAAAVWINAHLTDLQAGGGGQLDEVAMPGLLDDAPDGALQAITSVLAGPDREVVDATYEFLVGMDGAPLWARVNVVVRWSGGDGTVSQLVFVPGTDGTPVLVAGGRADDATAEHSLGTGTAAGEVDS